MNLKKYLKTILVKKAQASLEYFIVFALIAGLTILSVSTFLNRTRAASAGLYNKAVARILN